MELRHLRYFVAVAEEENVSRAALKLHVSQPGLSRQIRDLEDEIGFQLFERSAKALRLTAAGKIFLAEARGVLQHAEDAVKKARAAAGGTQGEIHVGYAPSLTVQILPPMLRAFQGEFPHVRVMLHDLSSEEMLEELGAGKLQVALTVRPPTKMLRRLSFVELARYATCVAMSPQHPLAKSRALTLPQVAREPLIGMTRKDYPDYHNEIGKLFAAVGCKPRFVEEHEGGTGLIAAVEAGRGVSLVPSSLLCVVGARLKLIPLKPALPPIPVGAIWLKDNQSEMVKKFIAAARRKPLDQK
ncbi:MAG TPA: LysR substrate-binding domain-containing protein [Verrucomicrobiae bacterium]|jgi:DNA-binding transcriptional LysR family regulator|nr:LysR substrate-binding domain-containing protein [Verrucomicrobiae bacterium]